jgi:uncharacterized protein (DUF1810 family)
MGDPWRLDRYVTAQERGSTYQRAVAELHAGAKVSHWMWFVFPQIAGLGMSAMSREYAISSIAEARAYLDHPVLGPRLVECAGIVAGTEGRSAERIFGPVDAMKLRSSMTLFAAVADAGVDEDDAGRAAASGANVFRAVLAKFFGGAADEATLARLLRRRRPRRAKTVHRHWPGSRPTSSAPSAHSRAAAASLATAVAKTVRWPGPRRGSGARRGPGGDPCPPDAGRAWRRSS